MNLGTPEIQAALGIRLLSIDQFWSRAEGLATPEIQALGVQTEHCVWKRGKLQEGAVPPRLGGLEEEAANRVRPCMRLTMPWASPGTPRMMWGEVCNWPELDMLPVRFCAACVNDGSPGSPPPDAAAKLQWRREEEKLLRSQLQTVTFSGEFLPALDLCHSVFLVLEEAEAARKHWGEPSLRNLLTWGSPHTTSPHLRFSRSAHPWGRGGSSWLRSSPFQRLGSLCHVEAKAQRGYEPCLRLFG